MTDWKGEKLNLCLYGASHDSFVGAVLTGIPAGEKISRGKHTTRHVELFELESGGFVLDTPGFSSLEIENIKADDLWQYFPEMADSQNKCRFRGCSHINEPDCYIKEKLENGEMAKSRYDSYTQIYNKLKSVKEWKKK